MKAAVLYYSHKGKTAGYAREIAMYLWSKGLNVSLSSISDAVPEKLSDCDFLVILVQSNTTRTVAKCG